MDKMKDLYDLCETISQEIAEANEKINAAGGKITAGDVDYIDKLTHSLKSIKATMQMMEDEGDEYSNRGSYDGGSYRGSYRGGGGGGGSNRGGSYARGGRSNANRRGGSSRYSRDDGMVDELRELMEDAPNESVRRDIQRLMDKIGQM